MTNDYYYKEITGLFIYLGKMSQNDPILVYAVTAASY